ncbi:MAG: PAS domain S-box protein [Desulfobacterales bacterium]|nr:PAS domain S-box protein [Desulfobacterales bacterium]
MRKKSDFVQFIREDIFNFDYSFKKRYLSSLIIIGIAANFVFYLVLEYLVGYKESLVLRLISMALLLSCFLFNFQKLKSALAKIYYEFVMAAALPFFFTYSMLLNDINTYWFSSLVFSGLIYGLVSKPYVFPGGYILGAAAGVWLFSINHDLAQSDIQYSLQAHLIAYLSAFMSNALIVGIERATRRATRLQVEKARLEETMLNYKKVVLTEEKLRESEEKHRAILENMEDGYFEVDLTGHLTFFNASLCDHLDYSQQELMGMNFKNYTNADNAAKLFRTFNHVLSSGERRTSIEFQIVTKSGVSKVFETPVALIRDEKGDPAGFRGLARDVTEQRRMESMLQRSEKMEALGVLAGGVAHDLNNILTGIVSYPDFLLMDMPRDSPMRKPLLTMKRSGEKASAIVQDLLTLARRGVAVKQTANLNDLIAEYLNSPEYEKMISFHPLVRVETDLDPGIKNISGSPVHLSKTIMNLVSNAAEAMPEGGGIRVSTRNSYIDLPIDGYDKVEEGDYVILEVRDSGTGIAAEDLPKIFEPFFTKKTMGRSGTGLGMTVVWGTVKDHDGYIDIKSVKGEGTTLNLYFPAAGEAAVVRKRSISSIDEFKGSGETILVVDDVREQREITCVMLERLGYLVVSFSSGEEAVEYMKTNSADLLVLDMIMDPGIDGLTTYKRIIERHPGQKAIIISGFSRTDRVRDALALGVGKYIKKPYSMDAIGLAVREVLNREPLFF